VRSLALGDEGRVGLHALPGAESSYEYRNMMRYEASPEDFIDADDEQLTHLEYPASRRPEL
jgi:hypothetical protein